MDIARSCVYSASFVFSHPHFLEVCKKTEEGGKKKRGKKKKEGGREEFSSCPRCGRSDSWFPIRIRFA